MGCRPKRPSERRGRRRPKRPDRPAHPGQPHRGHPTARTRRRSTDPIRPTLPIPCRPIPRRLPIPTNLLFPQRSRRSLPLASRPPPLRTMRPSRRHRRPSSWDPACRRTDRRRRFQGRKAPPSRRGPRSPSHLRPRGLTTLPLAGLQPPEPDAPEIEPRQPRPASPRGIGAASSGYLQTPPPQSRVHAHNPVRASHEQLDGAHSDEPAAGGVG